MLRIEASVSSDLSGILKRIKVKDLTKDGVSCFLTNARDAEQQLFFSGKVVILVEVRPNKLLYASDLQDNEYGYQAQEPHRQSGYRT